MCGGGGGLFGETWLGFVFEGGILGGRGGEGEDGNGEMLGRVGKD